MDRVDGPVPGKGMMSCFPRTGDDRPFNGRTPGKRAQDVRGMKKTTAMALLVCAAVLMAWENGSIAAQDAFELKAPNGISFSEIKGYETWQVIAPSRRTDNNELRIILGNGTMINAFKEGVPGNGKPFPDGSVVVKIGWSEKQNPDFPAAYEPDELKRVEFIMKDSQRFLGTSGWGYARFLYDAKTAAFVPYGKDSSFAQECFQCHSIVKGKDYIFTDYPRRGAHDRSMRIHRVFPNLPCFRSAPRDASAAAGPIAR
jgi:hypothetical protein